MKLKDNIPIFLVLGVILIFILPGLGLFAILPEGQFNSNADCSFITNTDYGLDGENYMDYLYSNIWVSVDSDGDGNLEGWGSFNTVGSNVDRCSDRRLLTTTDGGLKVIMYNETQQILGVCSLDGKQVRTYKQGITTSNQAILSCTAEQCPISSLSEITTCEIASETLNSATDCPSNIISEVENELNNNYPGQYARLNNNGGVYSCDSINCLDSDGSDYFNKGQVTISDTIFSDVCWDNKRGLTEYICENDNLKPIEVSCPSGYVCENDSCVEGEPKCVDPADLEGVIYNGQEYPDTCTSSNQLTQYYCQNDELAEFSGTCSFGCLDGKCLNAPAGEECSDSDNGEDLLIKGTVTYVGSVFEDVCSNGQLREYRCASSSGVESSLYDCPEGLSCLEGACISSQEIDTTTNGDAITEDTAKDLLSFFNQYKWWIIGGVSALVIFALIKK